MFANLFKRKTLRKKFAFWAVLIVVWVQIANSAILFSTKSDEITEDIQYNAENFARLTTAKVVDYYRKYNDSGYFKLYDLMDELLTQNQEIKAIYLIRADGQILLGPQDLKHRRPLVGTRETAPSTLSERLLLAEMTVAQIEYEGEPHIDILSPHIEEWGKRTYSVRYLFGFDTLEVRLAKMARQFIVIGLACIAVGIVLAILLSGQITQSITVLLESARQISKGEWQRKVHVTSNDEIGELSTVFESMRVNLKDSFDKLLHTQDDLRNLNQSLEQKVSERTLELAQKNEELERLSTTDRLTEIRNRRSLDERLAAEIDRFHRVNHEFGVVLLDLDHFKRVNDTHGHQVGDVVLKAVADVMKANTRKTDLLGRWGGEEFLVICPDTDQKGLLKLAEDLRRAIETYDFPVIGTKTASFGIALSNLGDTPDDIINRADKALYRAKEKGRNRVESS